MPENIVKSHKITVFKQEPQLLAANIASDIEYTEEVKGSAGRRYLIHLCDSSWNPHPFARVSACQQQSGRALRMGLGSKRAQPQPW